jgi:hypothetical protein
MGILHVKRCKNIIDNNELFVKLCKYNIDYELNPENLEVANFLYFYNNLDKVSFSKNILNFILCYILYII